MDLLIIFVFLATIFVIFWLAIKKPYVKVGRHNLETYALAALLGPVLFWCLGYLGVNNISGLLRGSTNPVNILILFLSMVFISVYLDEVGFLEYCAKLALRWAGRSGRKLFFTLYFVVSLLTIFTSNDIIILTLTPFIYYFTKHAKLNPKPYLIAEFFAANTWSIMLQIGNPTNIYVTSIFGVTFLDYLKVMLLPSIVAGLLNLGVLYLLFRKAINQDFIPEDVKPEDAVHDKSGAFIGVTLLVACIIAFALSSQLGLEMWKIAFVSALILLAIILVRDLFRRKISEIKHVLHRMPWSVVPFVFSFFIMVGVLFSSLPELSSFFSGTNTSTSAVFLFGISSAVFANFLNNIPMTVIFSEIIRSLSGAAQTAAVYATAIGSNIGAYFTPMGALAGIMWMSILKHKHVDLSYREFIKYGLITGSIVLVGALAALTVSLH